MNREELLDSKLSDTLAVLGSGSSWNEVPENKRYKIFIGFDTFALNWYCKGDSLVPQYYLIDEQGVNGYKVIPGFTPQDIIDTTITDVAIVKRRNRETEAWKWEEHLESLNALNIVVVDRFGKKHGDIRGIRDVDFYNDGVVNFNTCLANPVHFAIWAKYKRVIFFGVDLYDCRYYWGSNPVVALDGLTEDSKHPQADNIVDFVGKVSKEYKEIEWLVANKKSLLSDVIGVYDA